MDITEPELVADATAMPDVITEEDTGDVMDFMSSGLSSLSAMPATHAPGTTERDEYASLTTAQLLELGGYPVMVMTANGPVQVLVIPASIPACRARTLQPPYNHHLTPTLLPFNHTPHSQTTKFDVRIFWANPKVIRMLPVNSRMAEKVYAALRHEATSERVFNISGMTANAKRKKLNPENLCNATMCADQNKHFPVSAEELQEASSK
jgi:hypothetical protein